MENETLKQKLSDEIESELVEEILQKFEAIGIDTSQWEYKFGDGNTASEFIQAGISDYLETKGEVKPDGIEAIEFAEWIFDNHWPDSSKDEAIWLDNISGKPRTKEQLYQLFKQTKGEATPTDKVDVQEAIRYMKKQIAEAKNGVAVSQSVNGMFDKLFFQMIIKRDTRHLEFLESLLTPNPSKEEVGGNNKDLDTGDSIP